MAYPVPTPAESDLRAAFRVGSPLYLDQAARDHRRDSAQAGDPRRVIHSHVLRELLLSGDSSPKGHVRQLTVVGAVIVGPLDLRFAKIDTPIRLENCRFLSSLNFSEAELRSVSLRGSTVEGSIDAGHVRVTGDLLLDGMRVDGRLNLAGAHLEDDLHLTRAEIKLEAETNQAAASGCPLLDLNNTKIGGNVVAEGLEVDGKLGMHGANVGGTVQLDGARLGRHVPDAWRREATGSPLDGMVEEAIDAAHVRMTGDLVLDGACLIGQADLGGAHLEDDLHLTGATIKPCTETSQPADSKLLNLDNINVASNVVAEKLKVYGTLGMEGANVGGSVKLDGALLGQPVIEGSERESAAAWNADGLNVQGELAAKGLRATGMVRMIDASAQCVVLTDVDVKSSSWALLMDRLQCGGSLFCDKDGRDIVLLGGIKAIGVNVGATLYLGSGTVQAHKSGEDGGMAVCLQRARISDHLHCQRGLHVEGRFDISDAHIGENVELSGVTMTPAEDDNDDLAFRGVHTRLGGNLTCRNAFRWHGDMALTNAEIGGDVKIEAASDSNRSLTMAGLTVGHDMKLRSPGSLNLVGARITRNLTINLAGTKPPMNESDPDPWNMSAAADLSYVTAKVLQLKGRQAQGVLDLTRASVQLLIDDPEKWNSQSAEAVADNYPIVLNGLTDEEISAGSNEKDNWKSWLKGWLTAGTKWTRVDDQDPEKPAHYRHTGFAPQPYQQLATLHRRSGRDGAARDVLHDMYKQRNQVERHYFLKAWNVVQDITTGYGYRPYRAVYWIAGLALGTALLFRLNTGLHIRGVSFPEAALFMLGLELPSAGFQRVEDPLREWPREWSIGGHIVALLMVLAGLVLGASVIAAIGRVFRNQ